MNAFAPGVKSSTPSAPTGLHNAVLVGLFDVGTQTGGAFGPKRKVILEFELVDLPKIKRDHGEDPVLLSETFTATMSAKGGLRPLIEGWRGKGFSEEEAAKFDMTVLLGHSVVLNVIHKDKADKSGKRATVSAAAKVPAGTKFKPSTAPRLFSVTQLTASSDLDLAPVPDWVKKRIAESEEFKSIGSSPKSEPSDNDGGGVEEEDPFAS